MVDPSNEVPYLNCEVQDLLVEVVDLKLVPDLRSVRIPPPQLNSCSNQIVQHSLPSFAVEDFCIIIRRLVCRVSTLSYFWFLSTPKIVRYTALQSRPGFLEHTETCYGRCKFTKY